MNILCFLNVHWGAWHFVGTSWTPYAYTWACTRCGRELSPSAKRQREYDEAMRRMGETDE